MPELEFYLTFSIRLPLLFSLLILAKCYLSLGPPLLPSSSSLLPSPPVSLPPLLPSFFNFASVVSCSACFLCENCSANYRMPRDRRKKLELVGAVKLPSGLSTAFPVICLCAAGKILSFVIIEAVSCGQRAPVLPVASFFGCAKTSRSFARSNYLTGGRLRSNFAPHVLETSSCEAVISNSTRVFCFSEPLKLRCLPLW